MKSVRIRFYEELNDFLPPNRRKKRFDFAFTGRQTVKDIIESAGVPHSQVDLILLNGRSAGFGEMVENGDDISAFPAFETLDIGNISKLDKKPLRDIRFILDVHLGKLTRYLRLLGFDSLYRNDYSDDRIVRISNTEERIILTRDRGILKRKAVNRGYWIRGHSPKQQAREVVRKFDLSGSIRPFRFCLTCNGKITEVSKKDVEELLPPRTRQYYQKFYRCTECNRVYWEGSHFLRMKKLIDEIKNHP